MNFIVKMLKDGRLKVVGSKKSKILDMPASDRVIGSVLYVTDLQKLQAGEEVIVSGVAALELEIYVGY